MLSTYYYYYYYYYGRDTHVAPKQLETGKAKRTEFKTRLKMYLKMNKRERNLNPDDQK